MIWIALVGGALIFAYFKVRRSRKARDNAAA